MRENLKKEENQQKTKEQKVDSKLKPFIRWAGGKQNLVKEIFESIDVDLVERYFEPFLGGASFFLYGNFNQSFLSDLNPNLTNCYQQIKKDPKRVFEGISRFDLPVSSTLYYTIRKEFNQNNGEQTLEQAIRFIFLNRTSFNGIYRVNKSGLYNVPFGKSNPAFSTFEHLNMISSKLQNAEIFNGFYDEIENLVMPKDLVYLDPPYPRLSDTAFFNHYTLEKFDEYEQEKVAAFANRQKEKGAKVVISNADLPDIRKLYRGWTIKNCSAYRYISCKKERIKVKELIIKNF